MAQKSFDDKRTERINRGFDSKRRQRKIEQSLREFSKVGAQNSNDVETYEEMLDDMYDDLYDDE